MSNNRSWDHAAQDSFWSSAGKTGFHSVLSAPDTEELLVAVSCMWLGTVKISANNFTIVSRLTEITSVWGSSNVSFRPWVKTLWACSEWSYPQILERLQSSAKLCKASQKLEYFLLVYMTLFGSEEPGSGSCADASIWLIMKNICWEWTWIFLAWK